MARRWMRGVLLLSSQRREMEGGLVQVWERGELRNVLEVSFGHLGHRMCALSTSRQTG